MVLATIEERDREDMWSGRINEWEQEEEREADEQTGIERYQDPNNWTFQAPTHRLNPAPLVPPLHPRSKMALGGIDPAVMQLRYYHPYLKCREEVGRVMSDYVLQDGAFLLRNSFRKPGILTVTVMHHRSIKHFNLIVRNNSYALQHEEFNTVQELVDFYGNHDVPNEECVAHLRLLRPIPRPNGGMAAPLEGRRLLPEPGLGGGGGRNLGTRSISVITPPKLRYELPHRGSVDANIGIHNQNGHGHGGMMVNVIGHGGMGHEARNGVSNGTRPSSDLTQVPLPITKPQKEKKKGIWERLKKRKSEPQLTSMDDRAPAPLPASVPDSEKDSHSHYYSVIDSDELGKDRSWDLIKSIAQDEESIVERCECGLTVAEAELPNGWSMHLSQDPATLNRLFYMGPNRETLWDLPTDIMLQLTPDQQDTIRLNYGYPSNRGSSSGSSNTGGASNNTNSSMSFRASQPSPPYRRQPAEHECSSDEVFHS